MWMINSNFRAYDIHRRTNGFRFQLFTNEQQEKMMPLIINIYDSNEAENGNDLNFSRSWKHSSDCFLLHFFPRSFRVHDP